MVKMNTSLNISPSHDLQHKLERLSLNKERWKNLKPKQRLNYLDKLLKRLQDLDHQSWGDESSLRQGYDPKQAHGEIIAAAEEMVNSVIISGTIRALIRSYKSLDAHSKLPKVSSQRTLTGTHQIASVFPYDLVDRLQPFALAGIKGEVWTNSSEVFQGLKNLGQVSLVLGAGNQSFLAFGDIIHEMFIKGNVTILKHHPVRDFCAPFYDALFTDLIEDGFFVLDTGDGEARVPSLNSFNTTGIPQEPNPLNVDGTPLEMVRTVIFGDF